MPLNIKQEQFCREYIIDLNATQAAIRAGYSENSAGKIGHELWKKPEIQARIQELQYERSQRTQITADRVLTELARIGFSDIRKMFADGDRMKPVSQLCDDMAPAVSAIEVVTKTLPTSDGDAEVEYVHKVKLWDKNSALDKIAKHLGMLVDRVEHTGANGGPIETKELSDLELARRAAFLLAKADKGQ